MKRKKLSKLVALAAALTLALSVGMVAFAANSPTNSDVVSATDKNGNSVALTDTTEGTGVAGLQSMSNKTQGVVEALKVLGLDTEEEVEAAVKDILNNSSNCKYVAGSVEVVKVLDLELTDAYGNVYTDATLPEGGIDVTISAAGVKVGDVIYVLHWRDDGTLEVLEATVVAGGGAITVHLNSLSPIAIIKVMNASGGTPELKVVNTTTTSPKTGK